MTISITRGWCSANDAASRGGTVLDVSAGVRSISRGMTAKIVSSAAGRIGSSRSRSRTKVMARLATSSARA